MLPKPRQTDHGRNISQPQTPAVPLQPESADRRRLAGSCSADRADADPRERDHERLEEFDRPDRLPRGSFREVVNGVCADMKVTPDWESWSAGGPALKTRPLQPESPEPFEKYDFPVDVERSAHPLPAPIDRGRAERVG